MKESKEYSSNEINEIIRMMKVYHEFELSAKEFLSISAFASKHKEYRIKSAKKTLDAIEEYKKLPEEIRKEIEKDKNTSATNIIELEKLCREVLG